VVSGEDHNAEGFGDNNQRKRMVLEGELLTDDDVVALQANCVGFEILVYTINS